MRLNSSISNLYSVNHSCQLPSKVQWSRQLMLKKKRKRRQNRQLMLKKNKVAHLPSPSLIPLSNPHIWLFSKSYRFNRFTFRSKTSSSSLFVCLFGFPFLCLVALLFLPYLILFSILAPYEEIHAQLSSSFPEMLFDWSIPHMLTLNASHYLQNMVQARQPGTQGPLPCLS